MRGSQLILSALHFLMFLFLAITGACCILLAIKGELKTLFIVWLEQANISLKEIGILLLAAAFCVMLLLIRLYRVSYFTLKSDQGLIKMDMQMVHCLIENWWKEKFAQKGEILEVYLAPHQRLSIIAKLPDETSFAAPMISELELSLSLVLSKQLGYRKPFYLHCVF